ncbi:hypothetical protein BB560_003293 [Smittium megazygosporum]|uniref:Uncharacterized protein n=1 Tax=Smittium megazygosporum TaxID=133381 RepID=A0A2T9ZCD8_9FUNG|nr:hypothetical protein BB560_003293 [Smittium megazygosporum]
MEYDRHVPKATARIPDETRKGINDILIEDSNNSSNIVYSDKIGSDFTELRYLTKPKSRYPEIRLSFSKFYELCLRNYKKPEKITDIFNICDAGKKNKEKQIYYKGPSSRSLKKSDYGGIQKFKLNYFMVNHGKSDVDGHFGVLSRWFKDIERNMHLSSIEDLVSAFREKAETSENISDNSRNYHFQIYWKDAIHGLRIRAKVSSGFRNYPSLYLGDDVLMVCPLRSPDPSKYFNIVFRIKAKPDIRKNKHAHDRSNPLESDTEIMGSTSRNTQRTRMEMLRGIGESLSIYVVL